MAAMGSVRLFGFSVQSLNLILLMCFFKNVYAFMDMEELKSVYYGLDILSEPVLFNQDTSGSSVQVTSKYGQQYQCTFPDHSEAEKKKEEEEKEAVETGIVEMLKPMKSQGCLVKTKDWWTYEFCYGKSVRQYHMEDGSIKGNVIHLGFYESDFDWSNETAKEERLKMSLASYHSQSFSQGDKCDLTGFPRKVEIRFMCEENSEDYLSRIEESETCVYTMTVMTSRICRHPYLRPPVRRKAVPITCSPLLSKEEYMDYMTEVNERKEAARRYKMGHQEKKLEDVKKRNWEMDKDLEDALVKTARDVLSEPAGSLFPEADEDGKVSKERFQKMFGPNEQLWDLYQRGLELSKNKAEERKKKLKELMDLQKKEKAVEVVEEKVEKDSTTHIEQAQQDKDDNNILSEYSDEIEDIKKRFNGYQKRLSNIKQKLTDEDWENNIEKAIKEAEDELGVKLDRSLVSGLSNTLNKLVNELQDTQDELTSIDEEINGLKSGDIVDTVDETGENQKADSDSISETSTAADATTTLKQDEDDEDDDDDDEDDEDEKAGKRVPETPAVKGEGFHPDSRGDKWKLDKPQGDVDTLPATAMRQSEGTEAARSYDDRIKSPPRSQDNGNMDANRKFEIPSTFPLPKDPTQDVDPDTTSIQTTPVDEKGTSEDQSQVQGQEASPKVKLTIEEVDDADEDSKIPSNIKELLEDTVRKEYEKKVVRKGPGKLGLDDDHSFIQDKSIHVIQQEDKDGNTNRFIFVLGFKNVDEEGVEKDRQSALEENYGFVYNNNRRKEGRGVGGEVGENVVAVVGGRQGDGEDIEGEEPMR